jgi:hypothetical protein
MAWLGGFMPGAAALAIEAIILSIAQGLWDNSLIAFFRLLK